MIRKKKNVAIVAHDNRKADIAEWVAWNWKSLAQHSLVCTGTTGRLVEETITKKCQENDYFAPTVTRLKSGPLGGDQQLGAMICEGKIDMVIFFWDPMEPQPHDVDVKALLRISVLYNVPTASNRATADFMISSPLFDQDYQPDVKDYSSYITRSIDTK